MRVLISLMLAAAVCMAATPGSFRGRVVHGPEAGGRLKWLYVQGAKGSIRKVEISEARVGYAPEVKGKDRVGNPSDALREGVQVQVEASLEENGEWKASRVTILEVAGNAARTTTT
ncbi:MAG TPA: hypothetical protein VG897_09000 [Terriglobales bacterium]|nr:hypothetical protein [Terriglobales bacterium]